MPLDLLLAAERVERASNGLPADTVLDLSGRPWATIPDITAAMDEFHPSLVILHPHARDLFVNAPSTLYGALIRYRNDESPDP